MWNIPAMILDHKIQCVQENLEVTHVAGLSVSLTGCRTVSSLELAKKVEESRTQLVKLKAKV